MSHTRFDAADAASRRKLFVDGIVAHRTRASNFLTIEADPESVAAADENDPELGIPWIQFSDGVVNLDCTDDELESLKSLLSSFPAFKITEISRPEEAEGTNVRVSAKADPNRISQFLDAVFIDVFNLQEDARVWIIAV